MVHPAKTLAVLGVTLLPSSVCSDSAGILDGLRGAYSASICSTADDTAIYLFHEDIEGARRFLGVPNAVVSQVGDEMLAIVGREFLRFSEGRLERIKGDEIRTYSCRTEEIPVDIIAEDIIERYKGAVSETGSDLTPGSETANDLAATRQEGTEYDGSLRREMALVLAEKLQAEQELDRQREASAEMQREIEVLYLQMNALRSELNKLQGLLDVAAERKAANEVRLETLGRELNAALARAAQLEQQNAEARQEATAAKERNEALEREVELLREQAAPLER